MYYHVFGDAMALSADILNPEASLNFWIVLESRDFIPGEELLLVFRITNPEVGLRFIPLAGSVVDFTFNNADGTTLTKTAALNVDDRSIATITLQEAETQEPAHSQAA